MTDAQKRFCDEYLIDLNGTRAYKTAYPNCKKDETANVNASRLLRNAKVSAYIEEQIKKRTERTEIKQDQVLQELANIAFSNGTDFAQIVKKQYDKTIYDKDGNEIGTETVEYNCLELTPTEELTEEQKSAISSIKQTTSGIEIKTADKVKALELLGKHLGMFKEVMELNQDKPFEVNINIKK